MPKTAIMPKWATPERRAVLVALWGIYGNKCLLGHPVCSDVSHYLHLEGKAVWASKPIYLPCLDGSGTPIRGQFLKLFTSVKVTQTMATFQHLYDIKSEQVIADWKADDRDTRRIEDSLECIRLHSLDEPRQPLRGRFSAISKDIWHSQQPLYYIEGVGISGLTLKPFVRVRLASSFMHLYINLGDALQGVSKSKKRKAIRYGKPLPKTIEQAINQLVRYAVLDYLAH